MTGGALIGRDEELEALVELVAARDGLPCAVVLCGDAGIGKSALWLAACAAARERRYRVLSARPAESEARFEGV